MTSAPAMKIKAIAPWFGGNRMGAELVGRELGKLDWCGIPFCGGCAEIPLIKTRSGIAGDKHRHIINLAKVIADPDRFEFMEQLVWNCLFHPDVLADAQTNCCRREVALNWMEAPRDPQRDSVYWARDYFICCWLARGGHAGKSTEFGQGLSFRMTSSGGDSARRFRSAIDSLPSWHKTLLDWNFVCDDAFEFIGRARDQEGHGLYVDAPWPKTGHEYKHRFTPEDHERLALLLHGFSSARVVIRYGDDPLIRKLYADPRWTWVPVFARNQANNEVVEVLIINGPSHSEGHL